MSLWVNCLIENPAFDSQTKETLKTQEKTFGSSCKLKKGFFDSVMNTSICKTIMDWAKAKEKIDLGRQVKAKGNQKNLVGVPKLEDANDAGGKESDSCTLILTEGDSAKALAVAGLSVVGRDKFGVFPLKGKPLNVREASHKSVMNNNEIQNILKIMGLDLKKEYDDTSTLRYGSIMIMADQDYDGSHIKGLLLNMIAYWWPSLLKLSGFVREFITPIVKVWKGDVKKSFFTIGEYEEWKKLNNNGKGWGTKYYKGLGTSTSKEAKEYFKNIEDHGMSFDWDNDAKEVLDLAFNKSRADDRKDWISAHVEGEYVDHTAPSLTYSDFVNKELVCFSKYDLHRMIPSVIDGLKPSQRKVLYSSIKRRLTKDVKVAQLSGYISEHAAYHHGEASLQTTIVNMAQDYVGSNNLNLLVPSGQFGTRLAGGSDAASARYIFTRMQNYTRKLFHPDDDAILNYLDEEGQKIEPKWYTPVIPMVLVNGAEGIGSGWSTKIPPYNPRDLIANLRKYLQGKKMSDPVPWYRGYKGSITQMESKQGYLTQGIITKKNSTTLEINELPIKKWTSDYKEFLQKLVPAAFDDKEQADATIEDFREYHTENTVHFVLTLTEDQMEYCEENGLADVFKLRANINTTNLVLFDTEGKIKKYETAIQILEDYAPVRLDYYKKRKKHLLVKLNRECEILKQRRRFIMMVIEGKLIVSNKKKAVLMKELEQNKFYTKRDIFMLYQDEFSRIGNDDDEEDDANAKKSNTHTGAGQGYEYLLGMPLWSLTFERVEELNKDLKGKESEVTTLENTPPEKLWDNDLCDLLAALDELEAKEKKSRLEEAAFAKSKRGGRGLTRQGVNARKRVGAQKRKAEIVRENVKGGDSDDDDDTFTPGKRKSSKGAISEAEVKHLLRLL